MKIDVYNVKGEATGEKTELADAVFACEPSEHTVYLVVKAQMANQRQGTHSSKNRAVVSGGGRKPWKQKGRGVARAGTTRSPLWVGGGRVFGPTPHGYAQKINKKMKKLARRSVLSAKVKENNLMVVEDFTVESGKTRDAAQIFENFSPAKEKTLLLIGEHNPVLLRASRNLPHVSVQTADLVSTYELLNCTRVLLQKSAIARIEEVLS